MHKRLVNHCTIALSLIPNGPILIKSGKEGADPTKPDIEFVETYHAGGKTIYLPGSSLKGAIRAHAERIVRTVGSDRLPSNPSQLWANDPLNDKYDYLPDNKSGKLGAEIYKLSSFTDQLFGNTSIASRLRVEDAYPDESQPVETEERNGVAIDRVFGSVAVGPFNYQVCTVGKFKTKIHLKNFTLAQLGLIGLVLRDLNDGWFGIGFAKSRGLGSVRVQLNSAVVQYPSCELSGNQINAFGQNKHWANTSLIGAGEFLTEAESIKYGFSHLDHQTTPIAATTMDLGFGVQLSWHGNDETGVPNLFQCAVRSWSEVLRAGRTAA